MDNLEEKELIEYYRDRYEKELSRVNHYYAILNDEMIEDVKKGYDTFLLDKMEETYERMEELNRILQSPEEILKRGRLDDSRIEEKSMNRYNDKKEKFELNSFFRKLKQKIAYRDTMANEIVDENEMGRGR